MTFRDLTTALTLYRGGTLTLEEAAKRSRVSTTKLTAELRARGIPVRETTPAGPLDQKNTQSPLEQ